MKDENRILIEAIKNKRKTLQWSLRKVAEEIGVSFSTLSRLESLNTDPDTNTKVRLLNWLGDEANGLGLAHEQVAEVHFRAAKQIDSKTISHLVIAAEAIKKHFEKS